MPLFVLILELREVLEEELPGDSASPWCHARMQPHDKLLQGAVSIYYFSVSVYYREK
jgi:hypothetical protein